MIFFVGADISEFLAVEIHTNLRTKGSESPQGHDVKLRSLVGRAELGSLECLI